MPLSTSTSNTASISTRWQSWSDPSDSYASVVAPTTARGADELIQLADTHLSLATPGARALDLGTGTGAVACILRERFPHLPILATDISPHMIERVRSAVATVADLDSKDPTDGQPLLLTGLMDMRKPFSVHIVDGKKQGNDDGGSEATTHLQEGTFSHVFCSFAIQSLLAEEAEVALKQYRQLLRPDGILAISAWEQDEAKTGPVLIWGQAARKVRPGYENPPAYERGEWEGKDDLIKGLKETGFTEVSAREVDVGFNIGTERFLKWWWESGHLIPARRLRDFDGDMDEVKLQMRNLLDERYDKGLRIPMKVGIAVGRNSSP